MAESGRLSDRKYRKELKKLNVDWARGLRMIAPDVPMKSAVEVYHKYINTFLITKDFNATMNLLDPDLPQMERQRTVGLLQRAEELHYRHTGEHIDVPSGDPFKMEDI